MTVEHILKSKGNRIISVDEGASVMEALAVLKENRIGAVLVMSSGNQIAGVLSERDVVRGLVDGGAALLDSPVSGLMTRDVITCKPADSIDAVMALMTEKRIRHLPVMDGGSLSGVITIGDVVKQRIAEAEHEADALKEYIATG